jgi:hypothetical protein
MTDQHPITPPEELVDQWNDTYYEPNRPNKESVYLRHYIAIEAARWGADQELEACVNYIDTYISGNGARAMRKMRRPKPPSLKEQALLAIDTAVADGRLSAVVADVVRRALEQLDD